MLPSWLIAGAAISGVLASFGGAYWGVKLAVARHDERIGRLERDVGSDGDSGLRGHIAGLDELVADHETRITVLEKIR